MPEETVWTLVVRSATDSPFFRLQVNGEAGLECQGPYVTGTWREMFNMAGLPEITDKWLEVWYVTTKTEFIITEWKELQYGNSLGSGVKSYPWKMYPVISFDLQCTF